MRSRITSSLAAFLFAGTTVLANPASSAPAQDSQVPLADPRRDHPVSIVAVEGNRLYQVDEAVGLVVYDVSDADRPRAVGREAMVGWPVGLAVRDGIATVVLRTHGEENVGLVRVIDMRDVGRPTVLREWRLEGFVREARANGRGLYVVAEVRDERAPRVALTAVRLGEGAQPVFDTTTRGGRDAALRVVGGRVVLAYALPGKPGTRVEVMEESAGGLVPRGVLDLEATILPGESEVSPHLDASEASRVRVLGCGGSACPRGAALEVATLDVTGPVPRVVSRQSIESPGTELATCFDGNRLYLADRGRLSLGAPATPVRVVELGAPGAGRAGTVVVNGVVRTLVPAGPWLLVVGSRGDVGVEHEDLFVDAIDVGARPVPRRAGEVVLGDGWTSSAAFQSPDAVALRDGSVAIPFETWATPQSIHARVAVLDTSSGALRTTSEFETAAPAERIVPLNGRLLAATDLGLESFQGFTSRPRDH